MATYNIPEQNFDNLKDKIEGLSRKAVKLGLSPIRFEVTGTHLEKQDDVAFLVYEVIVEGQSPLIEGWSVVGKIEPVDGQNVVKAFEKLPTRYRTAGMICEHCNVNRYRIATYILRNEQGEYKQVGSTCLKDFTGHPDAVALAEFAQVIKELDVMVKEFEDYEPSGNSNYVKLDRFIGYVIRETENNGFISRSKAGYGQVATADLAISTMFNRYAASLPESYVEKANVMISWIRGAFSQKDNPTDYEHNMILICGEDYIKVDYIGYAASLVSLYQRENEVKSEGQFVGKVGDKITVTVTCIMVKTIQGQFTSHLHKFTDKQGNLYVWFSSSVRLEEGKVYNLSGALKEHKSYYGEKQNVLTRCKAQ